MTRSIAMSAAALTVFIALTAAQPRAAALDPRAVAKLASAVTFTGCLHEDGDGYKLTRLTGKHALARRSWKTAFIKKTTRAVEVVGVSNAVKLGDHIGRQVTVVGVWDGDDRVRAKSIKRVAASCS